MCVCHYLFQWSRIIIPCYGIIIYIYVFIIFYIYIYCIYIYMYLSFYIYIYIYMCVCVYLSLFIYIYIYNVFIILYIYKLIYVYLSFYIYVCVCVWHIKEYQLFKIALSVRLRIRWLYSLQRGKIPPKTCPGGGFRFFFFVFVFYGFCVFSLWHINLRGPFKAWAHPCKRTAVILLNS